MNKTEWRRKRGVFLKALRHVPLLNFFLFTFWWQCAPSMDGNIAWVITFCGFIYMSFLAMVAAIFHRYIYPQTHRFFSHFYLFISWFVLPSGAAIFLCWIGSWFRNAVAALCWVTD